MANLMAIVSKAVFEKAAGKAPALGAQLAMDRYVSANKNLAPLEGGGKLYLVTVRPPDEALWLVAVLDEPHFDGKQWIAAPCTTPLTDISALRERIRFESGKGMSSAPGTLGMSLQTPRALTAEDVALLDAALGGTAPPLARGALAAGIPAPPAGKPSASTDRAAALLAAVIADPDNDAARAVYADELSSRNDPRGELIHIEMALAGPLSIQKREKLRARRDELVAQHGAAWWPAKLGKLRVHRGFIAAVTGTVEQLAAKQLWANEPIVEVTVTDGEGNEANLVKAAWLSRVQHLVVRGAFGDEGFAALVAAKGAQRLRELNVTATELTSEGLGALGDHLPQCRVLVLSSNPIGDDGLAALRAWSHVGQLETLYASSCELTSAGVAAWIAEPLPALAKLVLSHNELDDELAAAFVEHAANLPALRVLELKHAEISTATIETLRRGGPSLARLDVRGNGIRANEVDAPFVRAGLR